LSCLTKKYRFLFSFGAGSDFKIKIYKNYKDIDTFDENTNREKIRAFASAMMSIYFILRNLS